MCMCAYYSSVITKIKVEESQNKLNYLTYSVVEILIYIKIIKCHTVSELQNHQQLFDNRLRKIYIYIITE